jgi:GPH family glycoside/pentoside/hexuronide:cation symporter
MSATTRVGALIKSAIAAWHARLGVEGCGEAVHDVRDQARGPHLLPEEGGVRDGGVREQPAGGGDRRDDDRPQPRAGDEPGAGGLLGALPRITDALHRSADGVHLATTPRSRWGRRRPYIFARRHLQRVDLRPALAAAGAGGARTSISPGSSSSARSSSTRATRSSPTPWVALGLRAHPRLPRAHAPDGHAELHRAARLRGVAVVPLDHEPEGVVPGPRWRGRRGWRSRSRPHHRPSASCPRSSCESAFSTPPKGEAAAAQAARDGGLPRQHAAEFFHGFATTLRSRPFLKLCTASFLVFNGFIMISSFQLYVIIYYVFKRRPGAGREVRRVRGHVRGGLHLRVIFFVTWLATRSGSGAPSSSPPGSRSWATSSSGSATARSIRC